MSAICGVVNLDGAPVARALLERMTAASPYRGPDGTAYWCEGNAGLAHLAFHVTPESVRERLPLMSADRRYVLAADVRLDNRRELIRELAPGEDEQARSLTDPDLLLRAYLRWGTACVSRLLGDFVFAVWDTLSRELFLARDPMGAHGFFWYCRGDRFCFASELTALLAIRESRLTINEIAVTKYLVGLSLDQDETFFEGYQSCPPAHCMTASPQGVKNWRYWDIEPKNSIRYGSEDEYTDHFLELLTAAVACRMRSLGPVGISLSGGCDSALIAAVASGQLPNMNLPQERLMSFSYVFDKFKECDEREWIQPVVDQYEIDATYLPADEKTTFSDIDQLPAYKEFFSYDCYVQLSRSIMEAAGNKMCRVILDGQYGDTLLAGSSYYIADALAERRWANLFDGFRSYHSDLDLRRDIIDGGLRPLIPGPIRRAYRKFRPQRLDVFNPGVAPKRTRQLREALEDPETTSVFNALSFDGRQRYRRLFNSDAPHGYAISCGKLSNRYGVERTSPYFDRRLIEFVLAVPPEQINRPDEVRFLQRSAMRRMLPDKVSERRQKTGFQALLARGMRDYGMSAALELGDNPRIISRGWVKREWFRQQRLLEQLDNGGFLLSIFVNLELWLRSVEEMQNLRIDATVRFD